MYLMNAVPQYRPETAMIPLTEGINAVQNLIKTPFIAPTAQAQLQQQQAAAQYAPRTMQADIAQKLALAQMYGGRDQYYQGGAVRSQAQANQINTGGNTPVANGMRQLIAAEQSGDPTQIQAAYFNISNLLNTQTSEIAKYQAQAQNQQSQGSNQATKSVNQGSPGGYVSPQLPQSQQQVIAPPAGISPPIISPQTGLTPQGNSPGQMQSLQTQLNGLVPQASGAAAPNASQGQPNTQAQSNQQPQYANQMSDEQIVKSVMNNQIPPLQPFQGSGGGIALRDQSVNAQKQMDSLQTFPSKIQQIADFYSNKDVQGYVGPKFSIGGVERGVGNVLNSIGLAPNSYNALQTGETSSLISGEGLSQLAVPGTRSGSLILKNINQLDPTKVKNPEAAQQQIYDIVEANIKDLTGYLTGNYLPSVRQGAAMQLQSAMKYPVYQQAYAKMQAQQNPQSSGGANQSPEASAQVFNYNSDGTLTPVGQ